MTRQMVVVALLFFVLGVYILQTLIQIQFNTSRNKYVVMTVSETDKEPLSNAVE